jgi:hypothetical protein
VSADVFEEGVLRFDFADDARDFRPEVARIFPPEPLSGDAERLAGIARNEAIHDATPRAAVEGAEIRPNRRRFKGAVRKARRQDAGRSSFPFHVTDASSCGISDS